MKRKRSDLGKNKQVKWVLMTGPHVIKKNQISITDKHLHFFFSLTEVMLVYLLSKMHFMGEKLSDHEWGEKNKNICSSGSHHVLN